MWILIGLAALILVLWFVAFAFFGEWDYGRFVFCALAVAACVAMFIATILVPLNRMGCDDDLAQIEAIRSTRPLNAWQDAAWRSKAAEVNADLASMKYWKSTVFGLWIPERVLTVKPIQ